jgi:uncharacterized protein
MANLIDKFLEFAGPKEKETEGPTPFAESFNAAAVREAMVMAEAALQTDIKAQDEDVLHEAGGRVSASEKLSDEAFAAIHRGDINRLRELFAEGLDANAKDDRGFSLLMHAVKANNTDVAQELLVHKADPEARNDAGLTALMLAAVGGNVPMAKMLLDEITDSIADLSNNEVALHLALEKGNMEVVQLIRARQRREEFNERALEQNDPAAAAHRKKKKHHTLRYHLLTGDFDGEDLSQVHGAEEERRESAVSHLVQEAGAFVGNCAHKCAESITVGWQRLSRFLHLATTAKTEGDAVEVLKAAAELSQPVAAAEPVKAPALTPEPPKPTMS